METIIRDEDNQPMDWASDEISAFAASYRREYSPAVELLSQSRRLAVIKFLDDLVS
jgi:hypothetical protein